MITEEYYNYFSCCLVKQLTVSIFYYTVDTPRQGKGTVYPPSATKSDARPPSIKKEIQEILKHCAKM